MFFTALVTKARYKNNLWLSTSEWIKNMLCVYIHKMNYLAMRKDILLFTWIEPEGIMLSEVIRQRHTI